MQRSLRIRWNPEERAAVIRRAQTLSAQNHRLSGAALFKESQECLPVERRREPFGNAVTWLKRELKQAGPLPSSVETWRPEAANSQPPQPQAHAFADTPENLGEAGTSAVDATRGVPRKHTTGLAALDQLVEIGVQLIVEILGDARVKTAVADLLKSPPVLAVGSSPETSPATAPTGDAPRREFVGVAGCSASEAANLAKKVDGALDVRSWASDEPRERLLELLPQAEIVFGVTEGIPKAVESSLSRLGQR